jgi:hypothetical protein
MRIVYQGSQDRILSLTPSPTITAAGKANSKAYQPMKKKPMIKDSGTIQRM